MSELTTCLSTWFPVIEAAGIPVPKTEILHASAEQCVALLELMGDRKQPRPGLLEPLYQAIADAGARMGWPCFLRTGQFSAKHNWKDTCFLQKPEEVPLHVGAIVEWSEMVDFLGLPYNVWVVREMLKTKPIFTAFHGQMPITREFRYFIRDGRIDGKQPYWPEGSLKEQTEDPQWREKLAAISRLWPTDDQHLTDLSLCVAKVLPGYWSIDWLDTVDRGWVMTDAAEGDLSFRYDPPAGVMQ